MKPLIYIVEDDEGVCEVYEGAFEGSFETVLFENGHDFLDRFCTKRPDIVILDIMLPDVDGYTILSKIRELDERVPVIIVSAKSDEISFVKGLNRGADDYMAKPFSVLELIARVNTNLRRANLFVSSVEGFSVNNNVYKIYFDGADLGLTLKEFKLFKHLLSKAGLTVEREALFREVWGESFIGETRTIDMHVASLREKIKAVGGRGSIITVRGIGYRYEAEEA